MSQFTITISAEEEKALSTCIISIQDWIDNAIHNRARIAIDSVVEDVTDKKAKKVSLDEKLLIVKNAVIETAIERNAKFEASLPK